MQPKDTKYDGPVGPPVVVMVCISCGYDLRRIDPTGNCPECGTPIAETIGRQLVRSNPSFQRALHISLPMLLAACLIMAGVLVTDLVSVAQSAWVRQVPPYVRCLAAILAISLTFVPAHVLGSMDLRLAVKSDRPSQRRVMFGLSALWLYACALLLARLDLVPSGLQPAWAFLAGALVLAALPATGWLLKLLHCTIRFINYRRFPPAARLAQTLLVPAAGCLLLQSLSWMLCWSLAPDTLYHLLPTPGTDVYPLVALGFLGVPGDWPIVAEGQQLLGWAMGLAMVASLMVEAAWLGVWIKQLW